MVKKILIQIVSSCRKPWLESTCVNGKPVPILNTTRNLKQISLKLIESHEFLVNEINLIVQVPASVFGWSRTTELDA